MKTFFLILLIGHGLIHFMGFARAFDLVQFDVPALAVSRTTGMLWLLAGGLLLGSAFLFVGARPVAWLVLLIGVLLSQGLIFDNWSETKFGTLPNLILLVAALFSWAGQSFAQESARLVSALPVHRTIDAEPITAAALEHLPAPVQTWLRRAGVVGRMPIGHAHLEQHLELRLRPDGEDWLPATAEQHIDGIVPAFYWTVRVRGKGGVPLLGRDGFRNGKGTMRITLGGLFAVVDEHDNPKIDEGALQRYLGELVWLPTAALHPDLRWETLDARTVRVHLCHHGTTGSGLFHFDAAGDPVGFTAERYKGGGDTDERMPWQIAIRELGTFDGLRIPVAVDATWELPDGPYHWLRLRITGASYTPVRSRLAPLHPAEAMATTDQR